MGTKKTGAAAPVLLLHETVRSERGLDTRHKRTLGLAATRLRKATHIVARRIVLGQVDVTKAYAGAFREVVEVLELPQRTAR